jgi:hypothetical protein
MSIKIATVLTVVGIMTLYLVVTKSSANDAFAATMCRSTIHLNADPGSVARAVGESVEQKLSGTLTCDGTGIARATITFSGLPEEHGAYCCTDSSGKFLGPKFLTYPGDFLTIKAHYGGDSAHSSAVGELIVQIAKFTPAARP